MGPRDQGHPSLLFSFKPGPTRARQAFVLFVDPDLGFTTLLHHYLRSQVIVSCAFCSRLVAVLRSARCTLTHWRRQALDADFMDAAAEFESDLDLDSEGRSLRARRKCPPTCQLRLMGIMRMTWMFKLLLTPWAHKCSNACCYYPATQRCHDDVPVFPCCRYLLLHGQSLPPLRGQVPAVGPHREEDLQA